MTPLERANGRTATAWEWFCHRRRRDRARAAAIGVAFALVFLAVVALAACSDGSEEKGDVSRASEWAALVASKRVLDTQRRELALLRGRLAAAPVDAAGAPLGEAVALAAEIATLERSVTTRSAALGERLVRYVGDDAPRPGETAPPDVQRAIRMKSDEDIEVAEDWIERGGDYRRAIEIYETQRRLDAGYPRLEAALERAREMRYVTAERLSRVEAGMTPVEVRAVLGPVNLREVRRLPAEKLQAWFYPKADGGRAAVYFRYDAGRRAFRVYETELAAGATSRPPSSPTS
jgi:hypothetical protein